MKTLKAFLFYIRPGAMRLTCSKRYWNFFWSLRLEHRPYSETTLNHIYEHQR